MSKRKHNTLNLEEKVKILKLIESGESFANIASKYGVGKSTVGDIKKNTTKILEYVSSGDKGVGSRKTLKLSAYPAMEKSLYTWFLQERSRGTPLSGDILCEKAKFFYQKIAQKDDFKASSGWLQKFKKRFGIRQLTVSGELLSSDFSAVEPFKEKLKKKN
ncbi:hypothetical protein NQ314_018803 [Rhamnusium bicolor]|uniref:HTH CENPB-type domain-containing protein n=1 Tax=Rhamnusium bicolor TaxID=1586634 RepID=A0AAV8WQQ0_9CUCU|nr:hypothetical protein NQ314_018803 [Rhamnusium bicolor]